MRKKTTRVLALLFTVLCLAGMLGGCTMNSKGDGGGESASKYPPQETAKYGVMTGSTAEQYVMDNFPDAKLFTYPSIADAIVALGTGKLDYVLTPYTTALNAIRKDSGLEIYRNDVMPDTSAIAVSKNNPELLEQIDEVLDRFRVDGTLEKVTANWTTPGADYVVDEIPQADGTNGTLRVAISADREPVCFVMDGAYSGLDCELISRIAYELDMKVEYQNMQFAGLIAALSSGKADVIISNMTPTEERSQTVNFTQSYFDNPQVLLAQKREGVTASVAPQETRPQVETSRLGVMVGSTNEIYAETNYPDADIQRFNNYVDSAAALTASKLDYAMMDYTNALRHIGSNPQLELASDFLTDEKLCLGINRNNPQLHEEVSQALEELREDGTLQEIIDHWIKSDGSDYDVVERPVREDGPVVKVAIVSSREPTTFMIDGDYQGLNVELIDRILYKLGYRPAYIDMEWGAVIASISSNKADMTLGMYNTPERAEKLLFTAPFFDNPQVLVSKKETKLETTEGVGEYTQLSQLEGKKMATLSGSVFDQYVAPLIPNVEFLYFNGIADQLTAVKSDKVEAVTFDEPVARLAVAKNPELVMMEQVLAQHQYAIVAPKGSALTEAASEVVRALRADGTLDEMVTRWTGSDGSQKVLPQLSNSGENGVIKIICYTGSEPMCYMGNGEITGYEVELCLRIGHALGKKIEFISADFTALMSMIQSGKADLGISCIIVTEERLKMVDMVEPHYTGGVRLVVRRQSEAPASGMVGTPEHLTTETSDFWGDLKDSFTRTFITENRWKLVLEGLWITVLLSVCSGIIGSMLGFAICMLRRSKLKLVSLSTAGFIRLIQGTPIVVILMILYYIIFGKVDISAILVAIMGFSINFGVYVSEMMRTGIDAVYRGQIEASSALGFTKVQTFWEITFPQAARHFLPVFKGEFISMVKMTSVVGYIAIQDLTKVSDIIRSRTLEAFFPLIATAAIYFAVANVMTMILSRIEIKLDPKRRKRAVKGVTLP